MNVCFCDACGLRTGNPMRFSYYCHLSDREKPGYVELKTRQPVSGRTIDVDLYPGCYNDIVGPAVQRLEKKAADAAKGEG